MSGDEYDDDDLIRTMQADREQWERKQARRQRIALWFLIPYAVFSIVAAGGMGMVLSAGMGIAFAALVIGFVGVMGCQWVMPELVWRREHAAEQEQRTEETSG